MSETDNVIQWIHSPQDNAEFLERHNQWAREYDSDLLKEEDYQPPDVTAEYCRRYVPATLQGADSGKVG